MKLVSVQFALQCNYNCFAMLRFAPSSSPSSFILDSSSALKSFQHFHKSAGRGEEREERKGKLCYETFLIDQTKRRRFFTEGNFLARKSRSFRLEKMEQSFLRRLKFERNREEIEIQLANEFLHTLFVWSKAHLRRGRVMKSFGR